VTANVINYLKTVEEERTNRAKEAETQRSNLAKEAENVRYNTEYLAELNRANKAKENLSALEIAERRRANQASEGISMYTNRLRDQELSEQRRHSKATEGQTDVDLQRKEEEKLIKQQDANTKRFEAELKKLNLSKSIIEDVAALAFRIFGLTY